MGRIFLVSLIAISAQPTNLVGLLTQQILKEPMREDGVIITYGKEYDGETQLPTYQCCHCGKHFTIQKGSGILRGYCGRCHAYHCGATCDPDGPNGCKHWRQKLEEQEKALQSQLWFPR